jgi:hypothetical protein
LNACNSFELGGEKKTKGAALTFVGVVSLLVVDILSALGIGVVTAYLIPLSFAWPLLL